MPRKRCTNYAPYLASTVLFAFTNCSHTSDVDAFVLSFLSEDEKCVLPVDAGVGEWLPPRCIAVSTVVARANSCTEYCALNHKCCATCRANGFPSGVQVLANESEEACVGPSGGGVQTSLGCDEPFDTQQLVSGTWFVKCCCVDKTTQMEH